MYEEKMNEVSEQFNKVEDRQNRLLAEARELGKELLRLQGEYRALERLKTDAQTEVETEAAEEK